MPPPGVCLNVISERHHRDGLGSHSNPEKFHGQDFHKLRHYCLSKSQRFVDSLFPPQEWSIGPGVLTPEQLAQVKWLRPRHIAQNPVFIVEGASRFDVVQGNLGNCWFLASLGALTFRKGVMAEVLQIGQSFQNNYAGIFHFRFWRFGSWVDVVIDDKLPTIDGRLVFVRSESPNEFWAALLEKAYAKVCGSYADMHRGNMSEALMDFTGGLHMTFELSEAPPHLWELLCRAGLSDALMGCSTPTHKGGTPDNIVLPNGLVAAHAYSITGVVQVKSEGHRVRLVRIFNPWGHGEWNGPWCDTSPLWNTVRAEDRQFQSVIHNGEFWMSLEDLCRNFAQVDICCQRPDVLAGSTDCHWTSDQHNGRWVAGTTAGGCSNHPETFWKNPQYLVKMKKMDNHTAENSPNILVSLIQVSDKRNRRLAPHLSIGFCIYEVPQQLKEKAGKFPASFFQGRRPVAQTVSHKNTRDVMASFTLDDGDYVIIPSTYEPDRTSSFLLTVFTQTKTEIKDNSNHEMEMIKKFPDNLNEGHVVPSFLNYSDKYEEVDAEQLQRLLNENVLKGLSERPANFSLDACRSIIAIMDLSVTGRLFQKECSRLWRRVVMYRDIFIRTDTSRTGNLSLNELQHAFYSAGLRVNDGMLNLMALRYGDSKRGISLESFICLILRMECMSKTFKALSEGGPGIILNESEWMHLTMYS